MDKAKPIYLHAGAHRTGTSSFQLMLARNRAAITEAGFGLAYPGRDGIPEGDLGLRLPSPRNADQAVSRFVPSVRVELARHQRARGLILSEENLPGRMIHFAAGKFYPAAEARFLTLARAAEAPIARVLLVVRGYADLYVSSFRKRAEDNLVDPFNDGRPKMMRMDRGWPELVALMQKTLQPRAFTVVEYDRRGTSTGLLQHLVPELASLDLTEPQRTLNRSATDAGLLALQEVYAQGRTLERAEWQTIIDRHRDDTEPRGFSAFKPRQLVRLRDRYAADLDRLAEMPGVTLLR